MYCEACGKATIPGSRYCYQHLQEWRSKLESTRRALEYDVRLSRRLRRLPARFGERTGIMVSGNY